MFLYYLEKVDWQCMYTYQAMIMYCYVLCTMMTMHLKRLIEAIPIKCTIHAQHIWKPHTIMHWALLDLSCLTIECPLQSTSYPTTV